MVEQIRLKPLKHLPTPWRITFDTNPDDCNLHCTMCEEHSRYSSKQKARIMAGLPPRRMAFETIEKVVAECAPMGLREIIPSTMGEPLLYRHFFRIIELCHKYNVKLNLTTNGTFPGQGAKQWAELIVPVGSDVKISWNGITPATQEQVMVGTHFDRQLDNLKAFLEVRDAVAAQGGNYCCVTLQLTFMEMNLAEIPEVVKLAHSLGCDRVKGHHLWVNFPQIESQDLRRSPEAIKRWNEVARKCHRFADEKPLPNGEGIRLDNFHELDPAHPGQLAPEAICPFLGQEAWVNWEGRFDPCCAPDELRRNLGDFGNVADDGLLAIWNSERYQGLMKTYLENEVCRGCNMRRPPAKGREG